MKLLAQLDALVTSGLIEAVPGAREAEYSFRHALIQEAAYDELLQEDRARLHRAVGEAMERAYPDRVDELASTLAHHFRAAGENERAVAYLSRAADRAAERFANAEAIGLLNEALDALADLQGTELTAVEIHERLGDLFHVTGVQEEASAHFRDALTLVPDLTKHPILRARLLRKQAMTLGGERASYLRSPSQALEQFAEAERLLGEPADESTEPWWREWLDLQLDRGRALYFSGAGEELKRLLDSVEDPISRWATPPQRSKYHSLAANLGCILGRFGMSDEVLRSARNALSAAQESGELREILVGHFLVGLVLLGRRDVDQAEPHLSACERIAERVGDVVYRCRAVTYRSVVARERGDLDEVRSTLIQAEQLAVQAGLPEYGAVATANRAWIAWRESRLGEVEDLAVAALAVWRGGAVTGSVHYPFEWFALWPLVAALTELGKSERAVESARALLDPSNQVLAPQVTEAIERALERSDAGRHDAAREALARAVEAAREEGYL